MRYWMMLLHLYINVQPSVVDVMVEYAVELFEPYIFTVYIMVEALKTSGMEYIEDFIAPKSIFILKKIWPASGVIVIDLTMCYYF